MLRLAVALSIGVYGTLGFWLYSVALDRAPTTRSYSANFATIRAASRGMMKKRWGRIINVTSVLGERAIAGREPTHRGAGRHDGADDSANLHGLPVSSAHFKPPRSG